MFYIGYFSLILTIFGQKSVFFLYLCYIVFMSELYNQLKQLNIENQYPFHMPGHKRQMPDFLKSQEEYKWLYEIYQMDITEIDGFDNLAKPAGLIKDIEDKATNLYGTKKSFIGVNGSTGCILAALHSVLNMGDSVLVARNCHKSVYHGIELLKAVPTYIYPSLDEEYNIPGVITPESVSDTINILSEKNIKPSALIITSPTYEGIVSDIKAIADLCHSQDIILIVDEAHGAHLSLDTHKFFPASAISGGADIVIESLHKTLPCMTQTAVLHICSDRVSASRIKKYINFFQTSSPSYIMMCSIEGCMDIVKDYGDKLFTEYKDNLCSFYKEASTLRCLKVRPLGKGFDPGKILISTKGAGASGQAIYDTLRLRFKIQPEMHGFDYCLMMTSIFDAADGFKRLIDALKEIDEKLTCRMYMPEEVSFDSFDGDEEIRLAKSLAGTVSEEFITPYPPGIPLVVPGETITQEIAGKICDYINAGITVEYM